MVRIIAVSGYKNSGKTTLCLRLLDQLARLGIRTGYIKRAEELPLYGADAVDTGAARARGVDSVLWARDGIVLESSLAPDTEAAAIASRYFPDAEIVILEGGKDLILPKIWVCSEKDEGRADYPGIFAQFDRSKAGEGDDSIFGAESEPKLAALLASHVRGDAYRSAQVYIGESPLPMKDFVADFVRGGVLGMLDSLKGADIDSDIRVYIKRGQAKADS